MYVHIFLCICETYYFREVFSHTEFLVAGITKVEGDECGQGTDTDVCVHTVLIDPSMSGDWWQTY